MISKTMKVGLFVLFLLTPLFASSGVPDPPRNVRGVADKQFVWVSFDVSEPYDNGGHPVLNFTIYGIPAQEKNINGVPAAVIAQWEAAIIGVDIYTKKMGDFVRGVPYHVFVVATNTIGQSAHSQNFTITIPLPTPVNNISRTDVIHYIVTPFVIIMCFGFVVAIRRSLWNSRATSMVLSRWARNAPQEEHPMNEFQRERTSSGGGDAV
jgi:hypothetical protein